MFSRDNLLPGTSTSRKRQMPRPRWTLSEMDGCILDAIASGSNIIAVV